MSDYIEDLSGLRQSFGPAALALLVLPILITASARNVTSALASSLLSFASFMLFVAPAVSGLAILTGLGSFVVALESIVARRRMEALKKEVADLTNHLNQLEAAEQRRLAAKRKGQKRRPRGQQSPSSPPAGP
jgi:hypothetical protein